MARPLLPLAALLGLASWRKGLLFLAPRTTRTSLRASGSSNPWREDPEAALAEAQALADAEWSLLQAGAELQEGSEAGEARARRASELLMSSALDRLRPYMVPAEYIDVPPLFGAQDALRAFLSEDVRKVANFMSGAEELGAAGQAFWKAELYLRSVHDKAGEDSVENATLEAKAVVGSESEEFQKVLRGSVLLARQNYVSAARFGYFLARAKRRLAMQQSLEAPDEEEEEEEDDFLAQLQKMAMGLDGQRKPPPPPVDELEVFLEKLTPEQAVELVRPATLEAAAAIELRASELFGKERELLRELERGPMQAQQLQMTPNSRKQLNLDASAFGAALFETESAAAMLYSLSYTEYGSRPEGPFSPY